MSRKLSLIATRQEIYLSTAFDCPPIPARAYDWSAIDANTYDADCDQDGYFSKSAQGCGETEIEAISDLLDQLEGEQVSHVVSAAREVGEGSPLAGVRVLDQNESEMQMRSGCFDEEGV